MLRKLAILSLLLCLLIVWPGLVSALTFTTTYTVITGYGPVASFSHQLPAGERVIRAGDKTNAYLVKTVSVRDEAHLLQLMGASDAAALTDIQKGLLESYRFAASQRFDPLKSRVPGSSPAINLELVDINGYTDSSRYKTVVDDFWPQNARVFRYVGTDLEMNSDIRISGTDCLGFGPETAKAMQSTFAHEFGHAMDLTLTENNAYGHDGSHYINEKIAPKASFAEGFANFIKMLFFPEEEPRFRETVKTVKIERPEGGYDEFPLTDTRLAGEGYLNVEAINTLIFTRLAAELPDGQKLVLDSFQKHNTGENRMSSFLKNFIADHPAHAETVARILNRETAGRLTDEEMRLILGNGSGVESFLVARANTPVVVAEPEKKAEEPQRRSTITIYKWKDASGAVQFTSQPPPDGREYTVINRAAEPGRASPVVIENPQTDPFIVGY